VAYEIAALELTHELYQGTRDRFVFEAFLIHVRALRDFFWSEPRSGSRASDVLAEQFFTHVGTWRRTKGQKDKVIVETWNPINRQLSHLTWHRIDRDAFSDLESRVSDLYAVLMRQWGLLLATVDHDTRRWFEDAVAEKRSEVRTNVAIRAR